MKQLSISPEDLAQKGQGAEGLSAIFKGKGF